ncbi:hypothetical protein OEA41_009648 [Lepraria neglecta]|uniref:Uncharacterized protein n=1 Tax=Lepraria neglecta TaxID=209136 RepID=A0AAE0DHV3_9LECA|nr:hypothetical protein OEA41_009648 [Lepraria neglecta]
MTQDKKVPIRRARDPYPVDTTGLGDAESMEDYILMPKNAIRQTVRWRSNMSTASLMDWK